MLHIVGAPGVGKSSVLKHLARRLQPQGRIIVLRNGRIIPGGWLSMAHAIGCTLSQDELFNELGCGGGATLFIDNIDQIDDPGDWATVSDLLSAVLRIPGWRAVVTGGVGNDDWKTKLPRQVSNADIATLEVDAISDDETALLSEENRTLAIILSSGHPARGIARNLFYLSRIIELGGGQAEAAAGIATEMDLARLWWRYGGGRGEDEGRLARLKVLRAVADQVVCHPGRVAFKVDDLPSPTVAELLRFDSFREEIKGATVAFRHDVLRDWAVGFLLHQDRDVLNALSMDKPLAPGLARGVEIAARLALESDDTGARWSAVARDECRIAAHRAYPGRLQGVPVMADFDAEPVAPAQRGNRGTSFPVAGADRGSNDASHVAGPARRAAQSQHSPCTGRTGRNPNDRLCLGSPQSAGGRTVPFRARPQRRPAPRHPGHSLCPGHVGKGCARGTG